MNFSSELFSTCNKCTIGIIFIIFDLRLLICLKRNLHNAKRKKTYDTGRKYNKAWEKSYPWLKCAGDSQSGYCVMYKVNVISKLSNSSAHEKTKKHPEKISNTSLSSLDKFICNKSTHEEKIAEIELSLSIACHSSIRSIDHISEMIKKCGKNSVLGNINLHRTKCTAIIKNVISASLKEELKNDLQGKKFVLLVDESTDIGNQKHLCLLVRFYCDKKDKIRTEFLSLVPVIKASTQILFEKIAEEIATFGQILSNCIEFASDGASCMVGNNNSLWSRIKNKSSKVFQMKCICHCL